MASKTFSLAMVGCLAMATAASAASVSISSSPGTIRTQTQGAGTYDVYDFFWTNSDGAQFTNYTVTGTTTGGSFADPARLQDDRQVNPPNALQDGNTAGAVDMWANTVWSSAGKIDLGLTATILPDPGGYAPTGTGVAPAFTNFKWDVFDNVLGDDNDLNDDGDFPTAATAPYHIMRVLTTPGAAGVITFLSFDTNSGGQGNSQEFVFGVVPNTPPVVDDEPPAPIVDTTVNPIVNTTFTATDATPHPPITFSNAVISSFVPSHGGSNPAGLFAASHTLNPDGTFTWDTTGFARGVYEIDVTATEDFANNNTGSGGNFLVTIANVPEPSTLALFGLAMVGLVGLRRRNG